MEEMACLQGNGPPKTLKQIKVNMSTSILLKYHVNDHLKFNSDFLSSLDALGLHE